MLQDQTSNHFLQRRLEVVEYGFDLPALMVEQGPIHLWRGPGIDQAGAQSVAYGCAFDRGEIVSEHPERPPQARESMATAC